MTRGVKQYMSNPGDKETKCFARRRKGRGGVGEMFPQLPPESVLAISDELNSLHQNSKDELNANKKDESRTAVRDAP